MADIVAFALLQRPTLMVVLPAPLNAEDNCQRARLAPVQAETSRLYEKGFLFRGLGGGWRHRTSTDANAL